MAKNQLGQQQLQPKAVAQQTAPAGNQTVKAQTAQTSQNDVKQAANTPVQTTQQATNVPKQTTQQNTTQRVEYTTGQSQTQNAPSYDTNADYAELISEAAASGNYIQAAQYEQQRNQKIVNEGLQYQQTSQYADYLPGGNKYYAGMSGAGQSLMPLIEDQYNAALRQAQLDIDYNTQGAVDQLNRALQDAQAGYDQAIAQSYVDQLKTQESQALYNQRNGDRGGIGYEQWSSVGNAYAKVRQSVAAEQRKLATDTARQITDLRAQGAYEEADALLTVTQNKLAAMYSELTRMQEHDASEKSTLASYGETFLSAGIMPSDRMLDAMGLTKEEAKAYLRAFGAGSGGGGSGSDDVPYTPPAGQEYGTGAGLADDLFKRVYGSIARSISDGNYGSAYAALDLYGYDMNADQYNQIASMFATRSPSNENGNGNSNGNGNGNGNLPAPSNYQMVAFMDHMNDLLKAGDRNAANAYLTEFTSKFSMTFAQWNYVNNLLEQYGN